MQYLWNVPKIKRKVEKLVQIDEPYFNGRRKYGKRWLIGDNRDEVIPFRRHKMRYPIRILNLLQPVRSTWMTQHDLYMTNRNVSMFVCATVIVLLSCPLFNNMSVTDMWRLHSSRKWTGATVMWILTHCGILREMSGLEKPLSCGSMTRCRIERCFEATSTNHLGT